MKFHEMYRQDICADTGQLCLVIYVFPGVPFIFIAGSWSDPSCNTAERSVFLFYNTILRLFDSTPHRQYDNRGMKHDQ